MAVEDPFEGSEIVERNEVHEVGHCLRDAGAGDSIRVVGRPEHVEAAPLRDHDRIVVTVVRPLDLDDLIAPCDGSHEVHRVHCGLGAGVVEPPQRQPESSSEVASNDDRVVGRLGEVRALRDSALDGLDDRRISVAGDHHAVAAVEIDVFGAVDVPDLRSLAVADPHSRRARDHPVRGGATGQHFRRLVGAGK